MVSAEDKNKGGRPPTWTEEKVRVIAEDIFVRLENSDSSTKVCRDLKISTHTLAEWMVKYSWFKQGYLRARYAGLDKMADDMLAIADQYENDILPNGKPNNEIVQRARLRIDTRKWILAKLHPAKYGDKVEVDHTGSVQVQTIKREIVDPATQPLTIDQKLTEQITERLIAPERDIDAEE